MIKEYILILFLLMIFSSLTKPMKKGTVYCQLHVNARLSVTISDRIIKKYEIQKYLNETATVNNDGTLSHL